jgi:hypothetical protein
MPPLERRRDSMFCRTSRRLREGCERPWEFGGRQIDPTAFVLAMLGRERQEYRVYHPRSHWRAKEVLRLELRNGV